jgi:hypothetical protein
MLTFCSSRYWNRNCCYRKEKLEKDAEAEEKKTFQDFRIKSIHMADTQLKGYRKR